MSPTAKRRTAAQLILEERKQKVISMYAKYLHDLYGTPMPPYTHPTLQERYEAAATEFLHALDEVILAARAEEHTQYQHKGTHHGR